MKQRDLVTNVYTNVSYVNYICYQEAFDINFDFH